MSKRHITQVADQIADAIEDSGCFSVPFDGLDGIMLTGPDEFTGTASFEMHEEGADPDSYRVTVQRIPRQ